MTLRPGVFIVKYEVSGLMQFLAFGSPFKMIKNAFCFTFKTLIVLLSWLFDHVGKWLDLKDKVDFKIYDVTARLTKNCNTHHDQYLRK